MGQSSHVILWPIEEMGEVVFRLDIKSKSGRQFGQRYGHKQVAIAKYQFAVFATKFDREFVNFEANHARLGLSTGCGQIIEHKVRVVAGGIMRKY